MNEHDPTDAPTFWRSPILTGSEHLQFINARKADGSHVTADLSNARRLFEPVPAGEEPAFLSLGTQGKPPAAGVADAMKIGGGFIIVSVKLSDILTRFNLGATQLIELPIYRDEHRTPTDLPPHFMLHVCETKDGFRPEESKGATRMNNPLTGEPLPNGPWVFRGPSEGDAIAILASDAGGVDLWGYRNLDGHMFFSDRLKQAIDAARIKSKDLTFSRCVTLPLV
ncbi:hypothetical protein [Gymnodinialimonas ulvae]|uniref:hypothetical protein n=1 Tax=Gymnodinialimonas ulvae TaxID=3126504 RepID=UPI0030A374E6